MKVIVVFLIALLLGVVCGDGSVGGLRTAVSHNQCAVTVVAAAVVVNGHHAHGSCGCRKTSWRKRRPLRRWSLPRDNWNTREATPEATPGAILEATAEMEVLP